MAAPTVVSRLASSSLITATSPKTAGPFTCSAGDLLVCKVISEGDNFTPAAPTGVTGATFTAAVNAAGTGAGNNSRVAIYTVTVPTGQTVTVTETPSVNTGFWGIEVVQYSSHGGVGNVWSSVASVNGAPSATQSTLAANSAIEMGIADWNAAATTGKTYLTATAGAFTETAAAQSASHYTYYLGRHADAGAAGSKVIGMSAPTGQKATLAGVEIKGTASTPSGAAVSAAAAAGIASGRRISRSTATSTVAATSIASGRRISRAAATSQAAATGAASGLKPSPELHTGSAASTNVATASASGLRRSIASHDEASGIPPFTATVTGALTAARPTSAASGHAVTIAVGSATSTVAATSAASGRRTSRGTAASTAALTAQATGKRVSAGSATSTAAASAAAAGTSAPRDVRTGSALSAAAAVANAAGRRIGRGNPLSLTAGDAFAAGRRISRGACISTPEASSAASGQNPANPPRVGAAASLAAAFTISQGLRVSRAAASSTARATAHAAGRNPDRRSIVLAEIPAGRASRPRTGVARAPVTGYPSREGVRL